MSINPEKPNHLLLALSKCFFINSSLPDPQQCSIHFYENKTLQIHFLTSENPKLKPEFEHLQTSQNNSNPENAKSLLKLSIDFNFHTQIIQNGAVPQGGAKLKINGNFLITDFRDDSKIQIFLNQLSQHKPFLKKYLSQCSWTYEPISKRFEIFKRIPDPFNAKIATRFIMMKDNLNYENHFVKRYERREFYDSKNKKINLIPLVREIKYQNILTHKNVMKFTHFIYEKERFYLFYEEKPSKMLSQHLKSGGDLPISRIKGIMEQLLKVLDELQLNEILHNKILPSSIFIFENNKEWKVCLGEFQLAYKTTDQEPPAFKEQEQYYLAPEMLKGNQYYQQFKDYADVFSLGLLLYELMFRKPYYGPQRMHDRIANKEVNFKGKEFQVLSSKCLDLMKKMLQLNPNQRIAPVQALEHNYFVQTDAFSPVETMLFNSFKSTMMVTGSFDAMIETALIMKVEEEQNRVRDREEMTIRPYKPEHLGESVKFHLGSSRSKVVKSVKNLRFTESVNGNTDEGLVKETEMDDTHEKLEPRDIRMMKPASAFSWL